MRVSVYDYDLPEGAVAQEPAEPRDAARLLVSLAGEVEDRRVADLPELLKPGDVLVVNETRVLPARLHLRKPTGGAVEVLLLERSASAGWWDALVRPSARVAPGTLLAAGPELTVEVGERSDDGRRQVRLRTPSGVDEEAALAAHGTVPLPPYVRRPLPDPERYQTVYGTRPGSVAAPTAGLHLTVPLLERCRARGVQVATVELVVGPDTFRPVTVERVEDHRMQTERYRVPPETLEACARARRVVAVGTTSTRALESAARGPAEGRTSLFIHGDFRFRMVDVLLTNFHLPRSTPLLLVAAFLGERWRDLYARALAGGYRFLSFGDAMLVARDPRPDR